MQVPRYVPQYLFEYHAQQFAVIPSCEIWIISNSYFSGKPLRLKTLLVQLPPPLPPLLRPPAHLHPVVCRLEQLLALASV